MRDALVHPVDCDCVLDQIVGSNAEEIDFVRKQIGRDCCAWNLNHYADFHFRACATTHFLATFFQNLPGAAQFFETGDHRKHDFHVADSACPNNRAKLRFENIDVLETKTNGAPAQEWIQLVAYVGRADGQFIATQIERPNNQRIGMHPFSDL